MPKLRRIYLDNAATSWPKPQAVYDAVDDYQQRLGAPVGRSGYLEAAEVEKAVDETRSLISELIEAESPDRIIFTFNGTDSLNLAIHGTLKPGDHVITTVAEHNSVLRPLRRLEKKKRNEITRVGCNASGVVDPNEIRAALRPETKLVILTHASNVTGAIQPAAEIGRIVRQHGALFLVDAAQTLGHMPVSVGDLGADMLAAPGHKGLLGPLGTGILYIRPGVEELVDCIRQGGTGSTSSSDEQPNLLPEKYESGNHNAPGLIGLGQGVKYVQQRGIEDIRGHAVELTDLLMAGLSNVPGIEIYGPGHSDRQIGVVSFNLAGHDSPAAAKILDDNYRIQGRAGFQCAALMHRTLGTSDENGTVRLSIGPFNLREDIEAAVKAIGEIAAKPSRSVAVKCPCVERNTSDLSGVTATIADDTIGSSFDVGSIPGLQQLWAKTLGDPEICVAVVDGPVDSTHPAFKNARLETLQSFASTTCRRDGPACMHGTHVASVLFGQHEQRVKGIAPRCRGIIVPIFRDTAGDRLGPSSQIDVARAITAAIDAGANVINVSGGELSNSGAAHPLLADTLKRCVAKGILVVAAAGNDGCACLHIPGAIPSVLAVGAMDANGQPLNFSNWSKGYQNNGILASGERILGALPNARWSTYTGTSFATPIVSGVVALLLCLQRAAGRPMDAGLVKDALLRSAVGCSQQQTKDDCQRLLAGRLNITGAITIMSLGDLKMKRDTNSQDRARKNNRDEPSSRDPLRASARGELVPAGCKCGTQPSQDEDAAEDETYMDDDELYDANGVGLDSVDDSEDELEEEYPDDDDDLIPAGQTSRIRAARSRVQPASSRQRGLRRPSANGARPTRRHAAPRSPGRTANRLLPQALLPSDCGCEGGAPLQLAYPLGTLGVDFGTESRRDSFVGQLGDGILSDDNLLNYLAENEDEATDLIWTLNQDATPIYAVQPIGAFADKGYARLREFLKAQLDGNVERVAIPGVVTSGSAMLLSGQSVPVLATEKRANRGMAAWSTEELIKQYENSEEGADQALRDFLNKVYYDTRNLGISSEDRALNYSVTNIFSAIDVFNRASKENMQLDYVTVEASPICRPESDCQDVKISFYNPKNLQEANLIFRLTVDVSDVVPVLVDQPRVFRERVS